MNARHLPLQGIAMNIAETYLLSGFFSVLGRARDGDGGLNVSVCKKRKKLHSIYAKCLNISLRVPVCVQGMHLDTRRSCSVIRCISGILYRNQDDRDSGIEGFRENFLSLSLSLAFAHRIDWIFIESRFLISLQLFGICALLSYPLAGGRAKTYGGADYWAAYIVKYAI